VEPLGNRTGSFAEQAALLNRSRPSAGDASPSAQAVGDQGDTSPCFAVVTGPASGPPRDAVVAAICDQFGKDRVAAFSVRQVMDAWTAAASRMGRDQFLRQLAPLAVSETALERWYPKRGEPSSSLRDLGRAASPLFQAFVSVAVDDALDALVAGKCRLALVNGVLDSASRADVIMSFQDRAYPEQVVATTEKALRVSTASATALGRVQETVQATAQALKDCVQTGKKSYLSEALQYARCASAVANKAQELAAVACEAFDAARMDGDIDQYVEKADKLGADASNACTIVQKKAVQRNTVYSGYGGTRYSCDRYGEPPPTRYYDPQQYRYQCRDVDSADRFVLKGSAPDKLISYVADTIVTYVYEEALVAKAQASRAASRPGVRGKRRANGAALVAVNDSCVVLTALALIMVDCLDAVLTCAEANHQAVRDARAARASSYETPTACTLQESIILKYVKHAELCSVAGGCPAQTGGAAGALSSACIRIIECLPEALKGDYKPVNEDPAVLTLMSDDKCYHSVLQVRDGQAAAIDVVQQNVADPVIDGVVARYSDVDQKAQTQYVQCAKVFERVARYLLDAPTVRSSSASYSAE